MKPKKPSGSIDRDALIRCLRKAVPKVAISTSNLLFGLVKTLPRILSPEDEEPGVIHSRGREILFKLEYQIRFTPVGHMMVEKRMPHENEPVFLVCVEDELPGGGFGPVTYLWGFISELPSSVTTDDDWLTKRLLCIYRTWRSYRLRKRTPPPLRPRTRKA